MELRKQLRDIRPVIRREFLLKNPVTKLEELGEILGISEDISWVV